MKKNIRDIANLYYTSLMTFLVFTFADKLLQGLIHSFCIELLLYTFMWLALVVQTTLAYTHINDVKLEYYTIKALLCGSADIGAAIYVCAAIGSTYNSNIYSELNSYCHLSIPFFILSITQFLWFLSIREFNVPALFRISILFFGMLVITISECIHHNFCNLLAVAVLIVLLCILRAVNKVPGPFKGMADRLWRYVSKI